MSEFGQLAWMCTGFTFLGLVFYSYVLYPVLLRILAGSQRKLRISEAADTDLPTVTVVMSVYNESLVIREKMDSLISSDYPADRLQILVGSDCSSDGTDEILAEYQARFPDRVRFVRGSERAGKPAMLNLLRPQIQSGITLLTDANVFFKPDTIRTLIRHFSNARVGLVGGNILNTGMRSDGISHQEEAYIQRENLMKFREGLVWGAMAGPFGGCYALRTSLFGPVPPNFLVDDFFICMRVLEAGYQTIFDPEAVCYEDVSNDVQVEFRRKRRISAGNFQNLFRFAGLLNPFRGIGVAFWSHKVLRWITPFLVGAAALAFAVAWNAGNALAPWLLLALAGIWLVLPLDLVLRKAGIHVRAVRFAAYFIMMNLALLVGFFRFLAGVKGGAWEPTRRMQAGS